VKKRIDSSALRVYVETKAKGVSKRGGKGKRSRERTRTVVVFWNENRLKTAEDAICEERRRQQG
jgi:hypothetical protein